MISLMGLQQTQSLREGGGEEEEESGSTRRNLLCRLRVVHNSLPIIIEK